MCYEPSIHQTTSWIQVLTSTNIPIKSVAILINSLPVRNTFVKQLSHLNIKTSQLIKEADPNPLINQILNSDCNFFLIDRANYPLLRQLISSNTHHNIIIALIQEPWVPDWTWTFTQCHFLSQQDLL